MLPIEAVSYFFVSNDNLRRVGRTSAFPNPSPICNVQELRVGCHCLPLLILRHRKPLICKSGVDVTPMLPFWPDFGDPNETNGRFLS